MGKGKMGINLLDFANWIASPTVMAKNYSFAGIKLTYGKKNYWCTFCMFSIPVPMNPGGAIQ